MAVYDNPSGLYIEFLEIYFDEYKTRESWVVIMILLI